MKIPVFIAAAFVATTGVANAQNCFSPSYVQSRQATLERNAQAEVLGFTAKHLSERPLAFAAVVATGMGGLGWLEDSLPADQRSMFYEYKEEALVLGGAYCLLIDYENCEKVVGSGLLLTGKITALVNEYNSLAERFC